MRPLSDLADRQLERALRRRDRASGRRTSRPRGFAILALGKLGGRELNYSSDIDLIFLYDPETLPRRPREEPGRRRCGSASAWSRSCRSATEDGYAFRVDLRLRPSPEVTPIALPVDAAISYYEIRGLALGAGGLHPRARLPPATRRSAAISSTPSIPSSGGARSISARSARSARSRRRIRDHYAQGQAFGPGFDLKRGRGGIREVEFFVQIHQLIHGGREPELRAAGDARRARGARRGRADRRPTDAATLAAPIALLRTIEHRLQMVDDRQTHSLPADAEALDNVARLHGLADGAALLDLLAPPCRARRGALRHARGEDERRGCRSSAEALDAAARRAGFADPAAARSRIEGWRGGQDRARCAAPPRRRRSRRCCRC